MSAAPRTALWGGRDGVGEEEGEGEKKEDPLRGGGREGAREGGRGGTDRVLNGVLTSESWAGERRGGDPGEETQRREFRGTPSLRSGGPRVPVKPRRGKGVAVNTNGGRGCVWRLAAAARNNREGPRWEGSTLTRRRRKGARARARTLVSPRGGGGSSSAGGGSKSSRARQEGRGHRVGVASSGYPTGPHWGERGRRRA